MAIYLAQGSHGGPIKVGYSADPVRRMSSLQQHHGDRLVMLKVMDGSMADERRAHRALDAFRVHGEWYQDCEEVRGFEVSSLPPTPKKIRSPFAQQLQEVLRQSYSTLRDGAVLLGRDAAVPTRTAEDWLQGGCSPTSATLIRIMGRCPAVKEFISKWTEPDKEPRESVQALQAAVRKLRDCARRPYRYRDEEAD